MPWSSNDAHRHTHSAKTAKQKRGWREVANKALDEGYSEGAAIRMANAVVHHIGHGHKSGRRK